MTGTKTFVVREKTAALMYPQVTAKTFLSLNASVLVTWELSRNDISQKIALGEYCVKHTYKTSIIGEMTTEYEKSLGFVLTYCIPT